MRRYLALGDSYTIGESVRESGRFPNQLAARLREDGAIALASPLIVAMTGWTTDELAAGIAAAQPDGYFELVTLLIGVNNQYRGRALEEYREQFRALLERAVEFAHGISGRVFVVSIPDWGVTPFAAGRDRARIAAEIDAFNQVNGAEANRAGARYVDITPVSRQAAAEPWLIASDGLHPSAEMYRRWVDLLLPEASAALGSRGLETSAAPTGSAPRPSETGE
jgi:lysophospholipase L1-like esterase